MKVIKVAHYYHVLVSEDGKFTLAKQSTDGSNSIKPAGSNSQINLSEVFNIFYEHLPKD